MHTALPEDLSVLLDAAPKLGVQLILQMQSMPRLPHAYKPSSFNACSRSLFFCTLPLAVMPIDSKSATMRR